MAAVTAEHRVEDQALWGSTSRNSLEVVKQYIDKAMTDNKWAIIMLHGVVKDQSDPHLDANYGWVTADVLSIIVV